MDFFIEGVKGDIDPSKLLEKPLEGEPAPFEMSGEGAAAASAGTAKPKVAFVYVGPVGDLGWSYAHDQGRLKMAEQLGVETAIAELVPEGPDAERVIRDFAEKGYSPIFATSFGYMDSVLNVAADYPDTVFEHATGYKTADNVGIYDGRGYQGWYLAGIVAGKMTKTNKLGYVAPFPIPEVVRNMNAFALGARSVNPDVTVTPIWINTWVDPQKEREAAQALFDSGVDVIARESDSVEPDKLAQEKGIYAIGYNAVSNDVAPDAVLTAPIWNWDVFYTKAVEDCDERHLDQRARLVGHERGHPRPRAHRRLRAARGQGPGGQGKGPHHLRRVRRLRRPDQGQHGRRTRQSRREHDRRAEAQLRLAGRRRARPDTTVESHTRLDLSRRKVQSVYTVHFHLVQIGPFSEERSNLGHPSTGLPGPKTKQNLLKAAFSRLFF